VFELVFGLVVATRLIKDHIIFFVILRDDLYVVIVSVIFKLLCPFGLIMAEPDITELLPLGIIQVSKGFSS